MKHDCGTQFQPDYGGGNEECDQTQTEPEILANDAARLSAKSHYEGEVV
jgi:hypothetical protein